VKFLLNLYLNPRIWDALTEDERGELLNHEKFVATIRESGEMISNQAIADPSTSAVVRVRDGVAAVTDGPYLETKEYLAGYYLVDCENRERALELAALIPGAKFDGIEVRPLMFSGGLEM
jgi:hypothetical protein